MRKYLLIGLFAVLTFSCSQTKYVNTDGKQYDEHIKRNEIVVFMNESEVTPEYKRIGLISSREERQNKAIKKAKKEAAKQGAHAILFTGGEETSTGQKMANTFLFTNFKSKWEFVVYRKQ